MTDLTDFYRQFDNASGDLFFEVLASDMDNMRPSEVDKNEFKALLEHGTAKELMAFLLGVEPEGLNGMLISTLESSTQRFEIWEKYEPNLDDRNNEDDDDTI